MGAGSNDPVAARRRFSGRLLSQAFPSLVSNQLISDQYPDRDSVASLCLRPLDQSVPCNQAFPREGVAGILNR